jgi:succinoglycan biosynthesis transport protein ExoP
MDETEIDLRGLLGLLRRQLRLILGAIVVIVVAAAIVVFSLTPSYTASALVLVDPSSKNLLDPASELGSASTDNARVDSEVEIMRSEAVLLEVVRSRNLVADPEFGPRLGILASVMAFLRLDDGALPSGNEALQSVMGKLRRAVSVQRRGITYLLTVQVSTTDPEKSAELANAVAEAYIKSQVDAKIGSTLAARDILQSRVADASALVSASEDAFDAFIDDNLARLGGEGGSPAVTDLRQRLEAANAESARVAGLTELIDSSLAGQNWATLASTLQSDAIAELERQRQELSSTLATVAEGSAQAIDLRASLARIENGLTDAARQEQSALRRQVSSSQSLAEDLRDQLRSTVLSSNLPSDVLTRIYELQQNSEIARNQYQTLLARVSEVEQQANLQIADSRVVSPALPPGGPSFPNPPLILALAAASALIVGIGLAFLYEHYIGGLTTEGQAASVLKIDVAAAVPRHRPRGGADTTESVANQMITAPLSIYSETVRRVRAELDQAIRRSSPPISLAAPKVEGDEAKTPGKVLMVSSAAPNEGKTTMALSLARAYAMSGRRVLLIDADLRKPSVHRHMGIDASTGLLEYLLHPKAGEGLGGILFREKESNLLAIVGARRSDVPTDQVVASKAFADLISLARSNFDMVVVDTPPVGPVVDGLYLAPFADVIAFVVRWASTSQQDARQAVQRLEAAKRPEVQILAILNQQEGSASSYRNKYAGYYSEAY